MIDKYVIKMEGDKLIMGIVARLALIKKYVIIS